MSDTLKQLRGIFVSLRLTVVLLALSIVLIFWATLDQVNLGIWAVQQKFFHSFLVWVKLGTLQVPVFPVHRSDRYHLLQILVVQINLPRRIFELIRRQYVVDLLHIRHRSEIQKPRLFRHLYWQLAGGQQYQRANKCPTATAFHRKNSR